METRRILTYRPRRALREISQVAPRESRQRKATEHGSGRQHAVEGKLQVMKEP